MPVLQYKRVSANANVLVASDYDGNLGDIENLTLWTSRFRVLEGLTVSAGTGLTFNVAAGKAVNGKKYIDVSAVTNQGGLSPSATQYVWLKDDGTFVVTANTTNPGNSILLAKVVTDATSVTSVDNTLSFQALRWVDDNNLVLGYSGFPVFKIDYPNQRLGLGVWSPAYRLDISDGSTGVMHADATLFLNQAGDPTQVANNLYLYAKSGDLYARLQDGQVVRITNISTGAVEGLQGKVDKAGDTMSGLLTLSGDPTSALHAATKQYVDARTGRRLLPFGAGVLTSSSTAVTAIASGDTHFVYIGRANKPLTSLQAIVKVMTAGASITWAEIAVFKGALVPNGNASLTRLGYLDTSAIWNATGTYVHTINLTGHSANDDLWIAYGSSATTVVQLRGANIADDLQTGVCQVATVRPSLASSPQSTTLLANNVRVAWGAAYV